MEGGNVLHHVKGRGNVREGGEMSRGNVRIPPSYMYDVYTSGSSLFYMTVDNDICYVHNRRDIPAWEFADYLSGSSVSVCPSVCLSVCLFCLFCLSVCGIRESKLINRRSCGFRSPIIIIVTRHAFASIAKGEVFGLLYVS